MSDCKIKKAKTPVPKIYNLFSSTLRGATYLAGAVLIMIAVAMYLLPESDPVWGDFITKMKNGAMIGFWPALAVLIMLLVALGFPTLLRNNKE